MGLTDVSAALDLSALRDRIQAIEDRLERSNTGSAREPGRAAGARHRPARRAPTRSSPTPSRVRSSSTPTSSCSPPGAGPVSRTGPPVDGKRVLTTRDAYPPPELPEHLVVVGSGVTGVEFVHMFSSFGCEVTLIVSRQQVLPQKDPEVAAALEADFIRRGVRLYKGARAIAARRRRRGRHHPVRRRSVGPRQPRAARHRLGAQLRVARVSTSPGSTSDGGYVVVDHNCQSSVPHIYAAGDLSGKLPLSSVASMQGRKIAEHAMGLHVGPHRHLDYDKAASAIFTVPEIADVGLAEADAFAEGRKIRVTKVPFSANAKALIENDPRGFVKIVSDPATGVVLGGSIVGRHAAELISVIALAVTAGLRVNDIDESLLVHPALAEALADAAE